MTPHTNFGQYSHQQLYTMLFASDPATVGEAADIWDSTGKGLHAKANDLASQLAGFQDKWQGGAAQQYQSMISDLADGIRKVADTAFAMRNLTHDAGEALVTARAKMPKPLSVPQVSPSVMSLATTQIQVQADTPPQVVAQMQQQQAAAIAQVRDQQQAVAASNAAHAEAVMVMQALAGDYATAQNSIPPSPNAEQVPTAPTTTQSDTGSAAMPIVGSTSWVNTATGTTTTLPANGGVPATGQTQTGSPLFGGMFTAGLAAASAAAFGRFGSIMPKVPGFAKPKADDEKTTPAGAKLGDTAEPASFSGKLPLGGGGSGVGGVGGVGGGAPGSVPTADASMVSGGATPTADIAGGALGAAVADAAGSKAMGPMMPMMPMNGAGGGDMGGGRRIPPWLVETEDVWGESSAVAPSVIGEDF